jgi:hypothetical protein
MRALIPFLVLIAIACAGNAHAGPVDELLQKYQVQGGHDFSVAAGEKLWDHAVVNAATGESRRCALCHTTDLRKTGKHAVTGKKIEPMAPSVNPERLADKAKIEKWLLRNCKWTLGRECTPQEKGDVLTMIRSR